MSNRESLKTDFRASGRDLVLSSTGASGIKSIQHVQKLWSGYGEIVRLILEYSDDIGRTERATSVVVKHIKKPDKPKHPRGWNTDESAARKMMSYKVEANWYSNYAEKSRHVCAMPKLLATRSTENDTWLVLEDMDLRFPIRNTSLSPEQCLPCLQWLARFHALHIQSTGKGLWPNGSYWHLKTRQDELNAMQASELKDAAVLLDKRLSNCIHSTLIHGDAKVANVCFADSSSEIAMVDFQYVGRGCGMRDVVYFLGSCLSGPQCEQYASSLLNSYFEELKHHLPVSLQSSIESDWRGLYAIAWADFHRFLAGWKPDHTKINSYTLAMTEQALREL